MFRFLSCQPFPKPQTPSEGEKFWLLIPKRVFLGGTWGGDCHPDGILRHRGEGLCNGVAQEGGLKAKPSALSFFFHRFYCGFCRVESCCCVKNKRLFNQFLFKAAEIRNDLMCDCWPRLLHIRTVHFDHALLLQIGWSHLFAASDSDFNQWVDPLAINTSYTQVRSAPKQNEGWCAVREQFFPKRN